MSNATPIPCPIPDDVEHPFKIGALHAEHAADLRSEIYAFGSVVVVIAEGDGLTRLDVNSVSLDGEPVRSYVLGYGSMSTTKEDGGSSRAAWQSLYVPVLGDGVSPEALTFADISYSEM